MDRSEVFVELLGLTGGQLLILAGVAVALLVLLAVLKVLLKLTKTCLGLGCLSIVIILAVVFVLMQGVLG